MDTGGRPARRSGSPTDFFIYLLLPAIAPRINLRAVPLPDGAVLWDPLSTRPCRRSPAGEYQNGLAFLFGFFFSYPAFLETNRKPGVIRKKQVWKVLAMRLGVELIRDLVNSKVSNPFINHNLVFNVEPALWSPERLTVPWPLGGGRTPSQEEINAVSRGLMSLQCDGIGAPI